MVTPTTDHTLADALETFASDLRDLPVVDEPPKTTLEIIDRRRREDYWNRLCRYFLDPSEPHGFGDAVLTGFVELIGDGDEYAHSEVVTYEGVTVEAEYQSSRGNRPDLFLYAEGQWGICVELKVTATEGRDQTVRYADDFPPDRVDVPAEEMRFVYVSKGTQPDSVSPAFIDVSWNEIVEVFDEVVQNGRGRYPERSVAQLGDFGDSILNEVSMIDDEFDERQREKAALYVKYYDEIGDAEEAYEKLHERAVDRWADRFLDEFRPNAWTDAWNCDPGPDGHVYMDGWRLDADGEPVDDREKAAFRVEFQHFLRWKPIFAEGRLRFRSVTSRRATEEYRETFKRLSNGTYHDRLEGVADRYGIGVGTGKKTHTDTRYQFDGERAPESFYETLSEAFDEHVELAPILTEIHEDAVSQVLE